MPMVSDMLQSKYLKKEDVETPTVFTIRDVSLEDVGQEGEQRWILWLNESQKGMVLNATKIRLLEGSYGKNSDDWKSQKVRLSHDPNVMFGSKRVGGIKMDVSARASAKQAAQAPIDPDFDDSIPF